MNDDLVDLWNERVSPEDEVYYLGDLVMGKITDSLQWVAMLNGIIKCVPGNHDRFWPFGKSNFEEWAETYIKEGGISEVLDPEVHLPFDGDGKKPWQLCHFPHEGDSHSEDRYRKQRPPRLGMPLIHGHVHDMWKVNGTQINVGADVWDYAPVHIDEIRELIS